MICLPSLSNHRPHLFLHHLFMAMSKSIDVNYNGSQSEVVGGSWKDRKVVLDLEEKALKNDIKELKKWTNKIGAMNDEQLKKYLKTRSVEVRKSRMQKNMHRVQRARRYTRSNSHGLMASVWKFHKDDDDDA